MEANPTPTADTTTEEEMDPVAARAAFFFDLELAELRATIPQAEASEGKLIY